MRSPLKHILLTVALPFLFACCGGGGQGGSSAPSAPSYGLWITDTADFDVIKLTWSNFPSNTSSIQLQAAVANGPYQALDTSSLPTSSTQAQLTFDPSVPELTQFHFRIRAVAGGAYTSWANADYLRTLRRPESLWSDRNDDMGIVRINWVRRSIANTSAVLERRSIQNGTAGAWEVRQTLPAEAMSAVDNDLPESADAEYRVRAAAGTIQSQPSDSQTFSYGLRPPAGFKASPSTPGITLSWINQSDLATGITLYRSLDGSAETLLATLPASATSYQDATATGPATYRVAAVKDALSASGPPVRALPAPLPGALALSTTSISLSQFGGIRRGMAGAWWALTLSNSTSVPIRLIKATESGSQEVYQFPAGLNVHWDSLRVDGAGNANIIYSTSDPSTPGVPTWMRATGSGTITESPIQPSNGDPQGYGYWGTWDFDTAGEPAVWTAQWLSADTTQRALLRHAAGGWTATPMPIAPGDLDLNALSYGVWAPNGDWTELGQESGALYLHARHPDGTSTLTPVPIPLSSVLKYRLCVDSAGAAYVMASSWDSGLNKPTVQVQRWDGSAWTSVLAVGTPMSKYPYDELALVADPVNGRVIFGFNDDLGCHVWIRNQAGALTGRDLGPQMGFEWNGVGPDGKFWVIAHFSGYTDLTSAPMVPGWSGILLAEP